MNIEDIKDLLANVAIGLFIILLSLSALAAYAL